MKRIIWKYPNFLKAHGITVYRLRKELGGSVSHRLPYDWAKGPPKMLHLEVLEKVLRALAEITGEDIKLSDILEYKVEDGQPS